jgi:hypothetical protein
MGVSVLPYSNSHKCNACTANLGRCGYLLTPTTDPIGPTKDTAPTPSLPATSVLKPAPILDASVITDPSALVPDSVLPLSPPATPLLALVVKD